MSVSVLCECISTSTYTYLSISISYLSIYEVLILTHTCQDSFIMREFEDAEVDFGEDGRDVVADVGLSSHCIYPTSRLLLSGPFSSLVLEKMSHEIRLLEKVG